jgi:acyl-CoA thioesterase I
MLAAAPFSSLAEARTIRIIALGDSLTAGFGLAAADAFPAKLAVALKKKGIDAQVINAGVSGDTATGGLERLDWSVPDGTDAVIVELGANDMLRGIDPNVTRRAIDSIVQKLRQRGIAVLVCGMLATPNMGTEYGQAFNSIFSRAAQKYGALFYPFFLDGVATQANFNQPDGLHPTAAGVDVIVKNLLPTVEKLVDQANTNHRS